jgi:hypothetical protein
VVATIFFKKIQKKICPQKVEKNTLKSCSEILKSTFFLTASTAQMAQTEEFLFQIAWLIDKLDIELGFKQI